MKTNFKKLAILAGTTAAMAAGSMSAHAIITSTPAPAQLVPLFFTSTNGAVDTTVRILTPRAVGSDTVISLLAGSIAPSTSWSTANTSLPAAVHWTVMSTTSTEVCDGSIAVTADSETYLEASDARFAACVVSGVPYYLILTNESARLGGAPTFQFEADAWIENDSTANGLSTSSFIPVLGMTDSVDTTIYPTPTNNVIENYPTVAGGPIASPSQTGIRTSSTTAGLIYRVVDVPVFNSTSHFNTLVAWADRNKTTAVTANGLTGKYYSQSADEITGSLGTFSFPNQLNIVKLGCVPGTGYFGCAATGGNANPLGILDSYTNNSVTTLSTAAGNDGFLKLVIDSVTVPTAATAAGAYSSVILFTIPANQSGGVVSGNVTDESEVAIDTGFFTSN